MSKSLIKVRISKLDPEAKVPFRATPGDAGADLHSVEHAILAANGGRRIVRTGISVEIPHGYVGLVHPRSGLAAKHGVSVVNTPGTIDAGYRGEIMVIMINHGPEHVAFMPGDRIAQLVIQKVELPEFEWADELSETARGTNGFGSSGGV